MYHSSSIISTISLSVLLTVSFLFPIYSVAQNDGYYDQEFVRNQDHIYSENIKTVLLFREGNELSQPVMELAAGKRLVLSFDDLEADVKDYRYTIKHCDAFWNDSEIQQQEYIEGFPDDEIRDYRHSFNTIQPYTNYTLIFPTQYLRLKKSGNYIIKVYVGTDPDENVVFTRRFMVLDNKAIITGKVSKTTSLENRYTAQQVEFKVNAENLYVHNLYNDIQVVVRQNDRWDNVVQNISPRMVIGSTLEYTVMPEITFEAGNEFRYFDMKTVRYTTDRMQKLNRTNEAYEVYLYPDRARNTRDYISEEDINGKRLILSNQTEYDYTRAEYVWVSFLLPWSKPFMTGNVYVFGELSNWQYTKQNRMTYDFDLRAYVATLYLKQGYYNYCYALLEDGTDVGTVAPIEGSHWETENEYTVYVYQREPGTFYDQLVGVAYFNSTL
jgi:hypothetical protein